MCFFSAPTKTTTFFHPLSSSQARMTLFCPHIWQQQQQQQQPSRRKQPQTGNQSRHRMKHSCRPTLPEIPPARTTAARTQSLHLSLNGRLTTQTSSPLPRCPCTCWMRMPTLQNLQPTLTSSLSHGPLTARTVPHKKPTSRAAWTNLEDRLTRTGDSRCTQQCLLSNLQATAPLVEMVGPRIQE